MHVFWKFESFTTLQTTFHAVACNTKSMSSLAIFARVCKAEGMMPCAHQGRDEGRAAAHLLRRSRVRSTLLAKGLAPSTM